MKNLLITILILSSVTKISAQSYQFSQSSSAYSNLTGTTSINGSTVWSSFQSFTVPIGFAFNFMGNNYNTIYIEGSGFCRFDANYYYLINPFTVQLEDKGSSSSLSPLSYALEGSFPSRILKIEWNNCGFVNDASGTANFQLWLYETSNTIEFHVGSCSATTAAYNGNTNPGPAMGIYRFSSVTNCVYGIGLTGNPAAATDNTINNANCDLFDYSLTGTPASGNVYHFESLTQSVDESLTDDDVVIYPNPSAGKIFLIVDEILSEYEMYDLTGKLIKTGILNQMVTEIDLTELASGTYLLQLIAKERLMQKKVMIR